MLCRLLNDIGFTIPAQGVTYWNGEATGSVDYKDLEETPVKLDSTTKSVARFAAHLAEVLKSARYPVPVEGWLCGTLVPVDNRKALASLSGLKNLEVLSCPTPVPASPTAPTPAASSPPPSPI